MRILCIISFNPHSTPKTVVLEKTLKSPLDCKEIQPVHPKGNQSWIFIGRTNAEAETPILWPPDGKNWLIGKDSDAGKDWRQEEKGMTEDEMVGWYHRLNGHGFGWTPGVGEGQGSLVCCSPWSHKELDTTEWLKWLTERIFWYFILNSEDFRLDLKSSLLEFNCFTMLCWFLQYNKVNQLSVQSLSRVQLFATPWTAVHQASRPSPTPGGYSNSCPSSRSCHPKSHSVVPFSSCLQSFLASGSFPMSQFFASGSQSIRASASSNIFRTDFL